MFRCSRATAAISIECRTWTSSTIATRVAGGIGSVLIRQIESIQFAQHSSEWLLTGVAMLQAFEELLRGAILDGLAGHRKRTPPGKRFHLDGARGLDPERVH